ncbi:MAG: AEC family transporter [Bacteroidetes bacterium]|nr:AEC family transporter [Bacteroidota bacterium]
MVNFLLIALCLSAGWFFRTKNILPADAHKGINIWILYIALPATALFYIPQITWNHEYFLPILMPFVVWIGAWIFLKIISQFISINAETFAALLLTSGLGNTSFVGFPLTQAYFGSDGLRVAVVCDQLSFITLSTFGVITAMHAAHKGTIQVTMLLKKIISFPPVLAFIAALLLPLKIDLSPLNPLFEKLAATLIPLALFSVGLQIRFAELKNEKKFLLQGLIYKLFIAPIIIFGIAYAAQLKGITAQTAVFESGMAPMVTSAILAGEYQLNPRLATLMVSIGIVVSLATTFVWWKILVTY